MGVEYSSEGAHVPLASRLGYSSASSRVVPEKDYIFPVLPPVSIGRRNDAACVPLV